MSENLPNFKAIDAILCQMGHHELVRNAQDPDNDQYKVVSQIHSFKLTSEDIHRIGSPVCRRLQIDINEEDFPTFFSRP